MANYRPISLLCTVSKLLEHIVYSKIINFISNCISLSQFGFMKDQSTLQQMLVFLNSIYENNKAQHLDFAKVFNRVPHNELLLNLWLLVLPKTYGHGSSLIYQCVCINGSSSDCLPVLSGVPQGSILGLLLFLIYINDLSASTQFSYVLSFADDTKSFKTISNYIDSQQFQQDLNSLAKWSEDWH